MNDDTPRNVIGPDDGLDRQHEDGQNAGASNVSADRGMPALGQYRGARPRAWWLTPVMIVLIVGGRRLDRARISRATRCRGEGAARFDGRYVFPGAHVQRSARVVGR